jgi:hypothetical protein
VANERHRHSKKLIGVGVVVLALVALRAALPLVVERYANRTLDELEGYSGRIEDVDLALLRGAYVIEGVRIDKTDGDRSVPFFSAKEVDLSVQWAALLDGAIVAEIDLKGPKVNFVTATEKSKGAQQRQEQVEPADNWTEVVRDLVPFSINRFSIVDGEVHYRDFSTTPQVDVYVQDLNAEARNLTNSEDHSGSLVASFEGRGTAMGSGLVELEGRVDPYAESPTFEADFRLSGLEFTQLNPYLRAFAKVDAEAGTFALDAEFAAKDGRFEGYVKPFVDNLDVLRWGEESEGLANEIWQGVVELASEVFQDQSRDRTAARIPFQGELERPEAGIWAAIGSLLRNAFIEALHRGLGGSVEIEKVSGQEDGSEPSD